MSIDWGYTVPPDQGGGDIMKALAEEPPSKKLPPGEWVRKNLFNSVMNSIITVVLGTISLYLAYRFAAVRVRHRPVGAGAAQPRAVHDLAVSPRRAVADSHPADPHGRRHRRRRSGRCGRRRSTSPTTPANPARPRVGAPTPRATGRSCCSWARSWGHSSARPGHGWCSPAPSCSAS